ncbi:hypothetical protein JCM16814_29870 [Desulfobaculum senezii]
MPEKSRCVQAPFSVVYFLTPHRRGKSTCVRPRAPLAAEDMTDNSGGGGNGGNGGTNTKNRSAPHHALPSPEH